MKCWIVAVLYQDGRPPKLYRLERRGKPSYEELVGLGLVDEPRKNVHIERISKRLWSVIEGEYIR